SFWPTTNTFATAAGRDELLNRMVEIATKKKKSIPRSYIHLMNQVREESQKGIQLLSWRKFIRLTEPCTFSPRKLQRAVSFLDEWGFVFHFPDEQYGRQKHVILNPAWLMRLFASVLGYQKQKEQHGAIVSEKQLRKIILAENFL